MFQQGGLAPLLQYTPVKYSGADAGGEAATAASKSSSDDGSDLTDKDLLKMLEKLDGLPNDMAMISKALQNFYFDQKNSPFPDTTNVAQKYMSILFQMKTANFNKKEYDNAYDQIKNNGGLNELAVDARGQVVCRNKENDFQLFTLDELKNHPGYMAVTNAELLQLRAQSPELINNNSVLSVVQQGIGLKGIQEMVKEAMANLGTDSLKQTGYTAQEAQDITKGLEIVQKAAKSGVLTGSEFSVEGLYKTELISESQAKQAEMALQALYQMMPENVRTVLRSKTKNGTHEEAYNLLGGMTNSRISTKLEFNHTLQSDYNPDGTKRSTGKDGDDLSFATMFLNDMGANIKLPIQAGTTDTLKIDAYVMSAVTKDGSNLGITTLNNVAEKSAMGGIFNFSQVTVGNQTVDMTALNNVIVNSNQLYKAYLPLDQEKLKQGIIAPNLTQLGELEKVRNKIKHQKLDPNNKDHVAKINQIYQQHNLPKFVDENGNVDQSKFGCFGVMNGTVLSDALPPDSYDNINFRKITDRGRIDSAWKMIKGKDTKESFDYDNWYDWNGHQEMLEALVYLPIISRDPIMSAVSGGVKMNSTQANNAKRDYAKMERMQSRPYQAQGTL